MRSQASELIQEPRDIKEKDRVKPFCIKGHMSKGPEAERRLAPWKVFGRTFALLSQFILNKTLGGGNVRKTSHGTLWSKDLSFCVGHPEYLLTVLQYIVLWTTHMCPYQSC